jgi:hypothetical protein
MLFVPPDRIRRAAITIVDGEYIGTTLRLPFNPKQLKEVNPAKYADHSVFGRSRPITQYTAGGLRTWNFEIPVETLSGAIFKPGIGFSPNEIVRNRLHGISGKTGSGRLMQIVNFIRALKEPRKFLGTPSGNFREGVIVGPPFFLFIWGDYLTLRLRMRNVEIDWNAFNYRLDPTSTFIRCQMSEHPEESPTFDHMFRFGDLASS